MILILFSKLTAAERHTIELLLQNSNLTHHEIKTLDLHSFNENNHTMQMTQSGEIILNGLSVNNIKHVICWNVPRCDALLRIDENINFPGLFRHQVMAFVDELSFSLPHCNWVPGTIQTILRGHTKMWVFKEALVVGLTIPEATIYAKHPGNTTSGKEGWYKKSLGFPCMVSYDKSTGTEKFIGNTNSICTSAIEDGHYWQWQSPIKAKAQVRCQIIGEKVWSVLWEKENTPFVDLRENVNRKVKIEWQPYQLPLDTARKVIGLMKRLKISIASPEFFIDQEDKLIFFDLNPCGDFRGFFPAETSLEMVKSIYELCP